MTSWPAEATLDIEVGPELICLLDANGEIGRVTGGSARGGEGRELVVDQPTKSDPHI